MVWNDFWESTQNYNVEAQDPALFLDNARDTISALPESSLDRGVVRPQRRRAPAGHQRRSHRADPIAGRHALLLPSSNQVNLQNSGPYKYMDPTLYYTALNHGFSVETGTPSFSTLESFRAGFRKKISGRSATTGPITTGIRAEMATWRRSWRKCKPSSALP